MLIQTAMTFTTIVLVKCMPNVRDDERYCTQRYRRLCQGKGVHVGCQYPMPGRGEACENYTEIDFNAALRHFVTHYINKRRQKVAAGQETVRGGARLPRPEIMMFVDWGNELAYLAQRLADQCLFMHDECRATLRYPYAGQAVGEVRWRRTSYSDHLMVERAIRRVLDAWWGERRRVDAPQLTGPFRISGRGAVWGHFSQLAVWSLRAVGCGAVIHGSINSKLLLVCDFSHTNMLGQKTLLVGKELARCPVGTERRVRAAYPLLCVQVRKNAADPVDREYDERDDYEAFTKDWRIDDALTIEDYDDVHDKLHRTELSSLKRTKERYEVVDETVPVKQNQRPLNQKPKVHIESQEPKLRKPAQRTHIIDGTTKRNMLLYKPNFEYYDDQIPSPDSFKYQSVGRHDTLSPEYVPINMRARNNSFVKLPSSLNDGLDRKRVELTPSKWFTSTKHFSEYSIPYIEDPRDQTPNIDDLREGILHVDDPIQVPFRGLGYPRRPVSEDITIFTERTTRRNWQQTRNRPPRPGAKALFHTSSRNFNTRKTSALVSLALDDDDINQLFKDTGFSMRRGKSKRV